MKKLIGLLVMSVLLTGAFASCNSDRKAPNKNALNTLKGMYSSAKGIEWEIKGNYFVAEFRHDGLEKEAWFDGEGTWWLTHTEFHRELPTVIRQSIDATEYKDWRIDDVDFIEQKEGPSFYSVELERGEMEADLYFSETGELLEKMPPLVMALSYL